jgi:hypothetical protein
MPTSHWSATCFRDHGEPARSSGCAAVRVSAIKARSTIIATLIAPERRWIIDRPTGRVESRCNTLRAVFYAARYLEQDRCRRAYEGEIAR